MEGAHVVSVADLVEEHYEFLYRYAYRLSGSAVDAEDLTQQAYLTSQRKLDQLRDASRARGWLCAIVRNLYLQRVRHENVVKNVSLEAVAEPCDDWNDGLEIDRDELQNALNELPEEFRTPLILFYFEQFSYKEIADQVDVPIGTVMSRLARAKVYLRNQLMSPEPAGQET